ncbi:Sec-independent protein translocase protein TatB [Dickeya undicola]|uniref:Sec-independent protein translocase protein TatB n=1 Tax=Dickeya undicola TaxID=1577887 RepID=A0A3N0G9B1_9GAMM|nr:Sec-independent protein translocase protein TatB [Dickeya undicola]RNM08806.1 Sec-independent protein translocase subunit TatB [Dickeya undicola]RNM22283.1 Sec-independent protein translocase subunit TatB [Dickeya undicola]
MFDIGFSELLLVMVIGLVVLGPERLPIAVRTVAGWIRALRSLASTVQNELAQELKLQELQDSLKKVEQASQLQNLSPELKASMDELKEAAEAMKRPVSIKPDAGELPEHVPLADPEAAHDGVLETERKAAVSASVAPVTLVADSADQAMPADLTLPTPSVTETISAAEHKVKPEQAAPAVSSQPSGDR